MSVQAEEAKETKEGEAPKETEVEEGGEEKQEKKVPEEARREAAEEHGVEVAILTIPLGSVWKDARKNRTPKAVRTVKRLAARYLKVKEADALRLSNTLDRLLWSRGIGKPPRKVRVRVLKDEEGIYTLYPVGVGVD